MKRIFLLSTLAIASFGMLAPQMVSAAPQQANQEVSPMVKAKKLVSNINQAVSLRGDQFSKVNDACVEYFKKLDELNQAKPADLNAQIATAKQTRDAKIKASLATDQLKSWAAFKE